MPPKPAWLAAAEAEIATTTDVFAKSLWFARGFPLTVIDNAGEAGRDVSRYPNLFLGFAVLLQNELATLGEDGRLRLTAAGHQAVEEEWLEGRS
jgi:hypothetical protein